MRLTHYWDAPDVATVPGPTSVVIRSRCGLRHTVSASTVRQWQATATPLAAVVNPCPTCETTQ